MCCGIWKAWCVFIGFISNALILFIKWAHMLTNTVIVSSISVIDCSILRPCALLFITISTFCNRKNNLFNDNFTNNWLVSSSQPINILCSCVNTSALYFFQCHNIVYFDICATFFWMGHCVNHLIWSINNYTTSSFNYHLLV